jgi:hypothetical protein
MGLMRFLEARFPNLAAVLVATWVAHFVTKAVLETAWQTAGAPPVDAVARKTKQMAVF